VVRFSEVGSATTCIAEFDGRWFNERAVAAEEFDGNRKRVLRPEVDEERQQRLLPLPKQEQAASAMPPPAATAAAAVRQMAGGGGAGGGGAGGGGAATSSSAAADEGVAIAAAAAAAAFEPLVLPKSAYVKLFGLKGAAAGWTCRLP
jgi:hypothetical protein